MSLTFYFAPMSTASTVHWSLDELGIPYEPVLVDLTSDTDKKAKLGPVNPNLRVPVLVHDGVPIFESAAIQMHLGECFGVERGLYPEPGPERGRAAKWLVWANVTLGEAVTRWRRHNPRRLPLRPAERKSWGRGARGHRQTPSHGRGRARRPASLVGQKHLACRLSPGLVHALASVLRNRLRRISSHHEMDRALREPACIPEAHGRSRVAH